MKLRLEFFRCAFRPRAASGVRGRGRALALAAFLGAFAASAARGQSEEFGRWQTLLNGENLAGWVTAKGGDPYAPNGWILEDGVLTMPSGEGEDLATATEFEDYELELEYRVPKRGNSGVYLRGVLEVQVSDNGAQPPSKHSAGAIYGRFPALENAQKPAGEWNRYRILHIGPRVTVWHNDVLVQDNVYAEGKTGGPLPASTVSGRELEGRRGPLMLQGDHGPVEYRGIRVRELFAGGGWRRLWNGHDLSELTARGNAKAAGGLRWALEDHALTNRDTGGKGHDLWTRDAFGNFLVHYAYKSDKDVEGGNSGFYLRDQWEIQIYSKAGTQETHHDGALYSIKPPDVLARHAHDQWNHMDVKLEGMKIWVWQNGKLIHDGVVLTTRTDDHGTPTPAFTKAPFKFQGDHGKVWFTDLYIRPLPDSAGD